LRLALTLYACTPVEADARVRNRVSGFDPSDLSGAESCIALVFWFTVSAGMIPFAPLTFFLSAAEGLHQKLDIRHVDYVGGMVPR
jgi:hypothetical protein